MTFYCPRDYKNGKYYFMIPMIVFGTFLSVISLSFMTQGNFALSMLGLSFGILTIGITLILFMPYKIYHNILNRLLVEINFQLKQKDFLWYGYDFNNYEEI